MPTMEEPLRLMLKEAFLAAADDGRLVQAMAVAREQKRVSSQPDVGEKVGRQGSDLETLRLSMMQTLQHAAFDGRLADAIASVQKTRVAQDIESMRVNMKTTLMDAACSGHLSDTIATVIKARESRKLQTMRESIAKALSEAACGGTLAKTLEDSKREGETQKVEVMRQSIKQTLQESLTDGRLSQAMEMLKLGKAKASQQSMKSTMQTPLPQGQLMEVSTSATSRLHPLTTAPTAAKIATRLRQLPPVIPPCKKSTATFSSRSITQAGSIRDLSTGPSAMMLDLDPHSKHSPFITQGPSHQDETTRKRSQSQSMNAVQVSKRAPEESSLLLPPISGINRGTAYSSTKKRSTLTDSFMWDVAPAIGSNSQWTSMESFA